VDNGKSTQISCEVVRIVDLKVFSLGEKPVLTHYFIAGIHLLNFNMLNLLPKVAFFEMPQLLEIAAPKGKSVTAFAVYKYWSDIGYPETLECRQGELR
jgi:NDP-sugar pyrophosphorylase family protein